MHEYAFSSELVRMALIFGVVISMAFYERHHLTTGGAIVPGYLAVALPKPLLVASTLSAAWLTHLVVHVLLPRKRILYGRRKFEVEALVGLGFVVLGTIAAYRFGAHDHLWFGLAGVGFIIPGIIAHDMGRQGSGKTLTAIALTTAAVALALIVQILLLDAVHATPADPAARLQSTLGYPLAFLLPAVIVSVLVGMWALDRFGVRAGGFITAPYVAMVLPRWPDLLFIMVTSILTWVIVSKVLIPNLLIFGRRKLAAMLLVSALASWSLEIISVSLTGGDYIPLRGMSAMTIMIPALIANDAHRQGWEKTAWGVAISTSAVFTVVSLCAAVVHALGQR